ncbi:GlxA family transcriptional regulator [Nocardia farcinica]|uniref:Multiple antibiotic resistance protein marA n=2 Tax=Nocardia TaxID=1817 RepID=A0A0H5NLW2_NOCFR|nr:DJ-1/PfpI family protein [Nocardia farcinica]AXK85091.1 AraC family transcriptional regulator [Nocardia farcinica]MBA4855501.1 DJ-1/PfpI family protein [Nocardia farcinica]MBC9818160.1 DJ-1/PfpI family protein [Nocardia farcinica]MBF6441668.1 DJ-1/PfpI family protein [Nocardia farcinica]CRY76199.1 Multiple antibiotic resistance protein marA [Nocardia farcinica]
MESTDRDDVVVALADGVLLLDVAGPVQVLHWARRRVRFASLDGGPVRTDVGAPLGADCAFAEVAARIDTLLVPGFAPDDRPDSRLVAAVGALAGRARRVAAVCTGAFVLAEAGLLDGRRATTHWMGCGELARRFPRVTVQPDAIYVRDGGVVTSAGVTAGIDMALALVEEDQGQELARTVAKQLVVFLRRPGGQSQFSVRAQIAGPRADGVRAVVDAVIADPAGDHSLPALAARAAMSERHLSRLFRRELGTTPGRFVERARVEAAQHLLEASTDPIPVVARRCGLGSEETLRRTFVKVLGVTPSDYRARFRAH